MCAPAGSPPPGHRLSKVLGGGGVGESRTRNLNPQAVSTVPPDVRLIQKMLEHAFLDTLRHGARWVLDLSPHKAAAVPVMSRRFDTIPSRPSRQASANTVGPSASL